MKELESSHSGSGQEHGPTTINILRHGPASYQIEGFQGKPDDADDLNLLQGEAFAMATEEERAQGREAAIAKVRETAEELADSMTGKDEEVTIWSSPTARTLQTAAILRDVLLQRGMTLRGKGIASESKIKVFERLDDVKNYNDEFYQTLVSGGELEIQGQTVVIDQAQTNPKQLHGTQYFVKNGLDQIPTEVLETWPEELVWFVQNMERYDEATKRIVGTVDRVASLQDKKRRIIVVTHAGLADIMIRSVDPETEEIIEPADYVTLEQSDEGFDVTRVPTADKS